MRNGRRTAVALLMVAVWGTAARPAFGASAGEKAAQAGVLVAQDLASDWAPTDHHPVLTPKLEKRATRVPSCGSWTEFRTAISETTNHRSPGFASSSRQIANQSAVFSSARAASEALRAMRDASVKTCLTYLYQRGLQRTLRTDPVSGQPVRFASVAFQPLSNLRDLGDEAVAYAGTLRMDLADGGAQQMQLGILAVRAGRAVNIYSFAAPYDDEISATLGPAIASTVARAQAALG